MKDRQLIPEMKFIHSDFFEFDWSKADCVLCTATCFPKKLVREIHEKAKALKQGSVFVLLSRKF